MKGAGQPISMNFARVNYRLLVRIRRGLVIASAALLLAAVLLVAQARSLGNRAAALEQELGGLTASMEKMRPAIEERQKLVKNLSAMTALLDARKFSWVRLLTGLERSFPSGVALTSIAVDPKNGAVSLEGTAHSPEALSTLMIGLQRSPSFKSPKLKRQSLDKGNLEFHVEVIYQDLPAGAEADGADR